MAASTITRDSFSNDTGSALNPNGDGTLIDNSVLQNFVYGRIDSMFAGAGAYATFTLGGIFSAEGFGTHLFSAGGTGGNELRVRNTTAGTTMYSGLVLGNDATSAASVLTAQSSTYTTSAFNFQDGLTLGHTRAGGISIVTSHASGVIRFYTGAAVETMRLNNVGCLFLNDTSNANMTAGLTINQGAADDEVLSFKSSDIAHGVTGAAETDTYGKFRKANAGGGLQAAGYSSGNVGIELDATCPTPDSTRSTSAVGRVMIIGHDVSGASTANAEADSNLLVIASGTASATRHIFDSDGDYHYDGAAPANYDSWDDCALLRTLDLTFRGPDLIESAWDKFVNYNRNDLVRAGILSEGGFVNLTKHTRLLNGGMWQLFTRVKELEARLLQLEA